MWTMKYGTRSYENWRFIRKDFNDLTKDVVIELFFNYNLKNHCVLMLSPFYTKSIKVRGKDLNEARINALYAIKELLSKTIMDVKGFIKDTEKA